MSTTLNADYFILPVVVVEVVVPDAEFPELPEFPDAEEAVVVVVLLVGQLCLYIKYLVKYNE